MLECLCKWFSDQWPNIKYGMIKCVKLLLVRRANNSKIINRYNKLVVKIDSPRSE